LDKGSLLWAKTRVREPLIIKILGV